MRTFDATRQSSWMKPTAMFELTCQTAGSLMTNENGQVDGTFWSNGASVRNVNVPPSFQNESRRPRNIDSSPPIFTAWLPEL